MTDMTKKENWPHGPWDDEPDRVVWVDADTDYDCMIIRGPLGSLCGYVAVPQGHPLYRVDYVDFGSEPSVHGGVTYTDECQGEICHVPEPGRPDDVWWIGFDCAHAEDVVPGVDFTHRGDDDMFRTSYKNIAYVRAECESLAKQLQLMDVMSKENVTHDELPHWMQKLSDGAWLITDKGIDDD